jgi:hypothetical protein
MASHRLVKDIHVSNLPKDAYILEIGAGRGKWNSNVISSANSTLYFNNMADRFKFNYFSVDFNEEIVEIAKKYIKDKAICAEGTQFLKEFDGQIAVLYLDNYDVVTSKEHGQSLNNRLSEVYKKYGFKIEENNQKAAEVHLSQLKEALPKMVNGGIVCIDDTIDKGGGKWWGKGALCVPHLLEQGWKVISRSRIGVLLKK